MKNLIFLKIYLIASLFLSLPLCAKDFSTMIELGQNWQLRNDVRIPSQGGTKLAIDDFDNGPFNHGRLEFTYRWSQKHGLRLIYAPLTTYSEGISNQTINFNGQSFNTTDKLSIKYRFNSYRLGYVYRFSENFYFGGTLKVRDASVRFKQNATTSEYNNTGLVPLFYLAYLKPMTESWSFFTDADFAAAPQGRAIDLSIKFRKKIKSATYLSLGLRTLEGGADNEKVYTFSWFTYLLGDIYFEF
ncbi:MAG: hypothetical protein JNM93_11795 [Bacteriovoracaceae bacterium]|nr:hypothetical protein [Bacteriovoracaceae bacterium]